MSKRIISIDVIRGLALLGIFLMNITDFGQPITVHYSFKMPDAFNETVNQLLKWLVVGNFYPLFALLFGYGAYLFYENTKRKEFSFDYIYGRRLTVLLIVGLLHMFVIWDGDILKDYAGLGFLLLLFVRLPSVVLLLSFLALKTFTVLGYWEPLMSTMTYTAADMKWYAQDYVANEIATHLHMTWLQFFHSRVDNDFDSLFTLSYWFDEVLSLFPMMILGILFAKHRWVLQFATAKVKWWTIAVVTLTVGLSAKWALVYLYAYKQSAFFWKFIFAGPTVAVGYFLLFGLLYETELGHRLLAPFAASGKMAFTNYLTQSLVCTFLFNHYGLGFYNKLSLSQLLLFAVGFYTLQLLFSIFWLKRFRFGPFEYVWRLLTYGKQLKERAS